MLLRAPDLALLRGPGVDVVVAAALCLGHEVHAVLALGLHHVRPIRVVRAQRGVDF